MHIKQDYLPVGHHNRPMLKITPLYLVIHWTANESKGANAQANRNYFSNTNRYASAHYLVDSEGIVQALPDLEMGYHVGANTYRHPLCRNNNSIGIEMCVNADGHFDRMVERTIELASTLCKRYGINPLINMLRHYDVTGKNCPKFYVDDVSAWNEFRRKVAYTQKDDENMKPINFVVPTIAGVKTVEGVVSKDGISYFPARVLRDLGYNVTWTETGDVDTVTVTKK